MNTEQNKHAVTRPWVPKVLHFWFETLGPDAWFEKDGNIDGQITKNFLPLFEELRANADNVNAERPQDTLASILVLDQFPRNMFRDTPQAFATDAAALRLAKEAIDRGFDHTLSPRERQFLYMPFQHSEDVGDQQISVALYQDVGLESALEFARRHKQVIDQFGRFPHRNPIIGRVSTPEEQAYLKTPGSGF